MNMVVNFFILTLLSICVSCNMTKVKTDDQMNPLQNGDYTFTYKDETGLQVVEKLSITGKNDLKTGIYTDKNGDLGGPITDISNDLNLSPGHIKDGKFTFYKVGSKVLATFQYEYIYYKGDYFGVDHPKNNPINGVGNPGEIKDYTMDMIPYPEDASCFYMVEYEEKTRQGYVPRKRLMKVSFSGRESVIQTLCLREGGVMYANEQIEGQTYEDPNAPLPPYPINMKLYFGGVESDEADMDDNVDKFINHAVAMEEKPKSIADKSWYKQP